MKVFKFGGASVNSVDRIRKVGDILKKFSDEKILVVISAIGKTTNALEKITEVFFNQQKEEALKQFEIIKQQHLLMADELLKSHFDQCEDKLKNFFTEVEWMLHDKPVREFDYYYDQIVCTGELLSTTIISFYLQEAGVENEWIDVRDIIRTDDNFRDAEIDWSFTQTKVNDEIKVALNENRIVLTQGFIGSTDENESTTLGREGSDYTAAIFANMLDAESLTIWKDVEGVMNADPKKFPAAKTIPTLNYNEVIEMAYYGAQVIHPKTIKPLQNKNIPLHVKSFLDPSLLGTIIHNKLLHYLPPIIVLKEKQVMIELRSKDYSFVGEHHMATIYRLLEKLKINPNMTQNTAISFVCVLDDHSDKIEKLAFEASKVFDVELLKSLCLLTVRHYDKKNPEEFTKENSILLRQQTTETVQFLMQDNLKQ
jgi:aspartate kinase